eukprot:1841034-Rhodomonas_salina.1
MARLFTSTMDMTLLSAVALFAISWRRAWPHHASHQPRTTQQRAYIMCSTSNPTTNPSVGTRLRHAHANHVQET